MKKFFDELNEATTLSPNGYPADGTGITGDDDFPPGTTVFGDKMVPVVVDNRLTGKTIKYVPAEELGQEWNYDEFEDSMSMGSYKSYSDTLNGLDKILGDRMWKHTDSRKMRMAQGKWLARRGDADGGVKQTAKTGDDSPPHMELTKDSEFNRMRGDKPPSNDYWREVPMKNIKNLDILEKITDYVGTEEPINEAVIDKDDRKGLVNAILKGKPVKLKLDSLGGVSLSVTGKDNKVLVSYAKNEDLTITLVDICDSLGFDFEIKKQGALQHFYIEK